MYIYIYVITKIVHPNIVVIVFMHLPNEVEAVEALKHTRK